MRGWGSQSTRGVSLVSPEKPASREQEMRTGVFNMGLGGRL